MPLIVVRILAINVAGFAGLLAACLLISGAIGFLPGLIGRSTTPVTSR
jgi:hypothetical protein